ncbi:MAG: penicillin-binding protein activator [Gammaproteobacteria bacterium]|nr:penicillin-binding protein activator [Gammaproteobacteria bacterium]
MSGKLASMKILNLTTPLLALLTLLAVACSEAPLRPEAKEATPEARPQPPAATLSLQQAMQLYHSRQWKEAIPALVEVIRLSPEGSRDPLRLLLADALIESGASDSGMTIFDKVKLGSGAAAESRLLQQFLKAQQLAPNDPERALMQLRQPAARVEAIPGYSYLISRYYQLRAALEMQMKQPLQAVSDYIQRHRYLKAEDELLVNERLIWNILTRLPRAQLHQPLPLSRDRSTEASAELLRQWRELVTVHRDYMADPQLLQRELTQWQQRYPDHPISTTLLQEIQGLSQQPPLPTKQIAILLPLSGPLSRAGEAIREGILGGYYLDQERGERSLRFYDTAGDPAQGEVSYHQAVADGCDAIIGPLNKEVLEPLLATIPTLKTESVPTLILNQIEGALPPNIFSYSLAPEEEARNSARFAWDQGYLRAALLLPEDSIGHRLGDQFRLVWETLGGEVVTENYYAPEENDFSPTITSLLKLDESQQRYDRLRQILREKIEFTPRRRQDIDFIFFSAYPRQARLIRPQLQFHHAAELPVIATSHLYSGTADLDHNRDLNGVKFGDMPWILTPDESRAPYPITLTERHRGGMLQRLVAMGIDAYHLLPNLQLLQLNPTRQQQGVSGRLSVNLRQEIERQPIWAQFEQGEARPLPAASAAPAL